MSEREEPFDTFNGIRTCTTVDLWHEHSINVITVNCELQSSK